VGERKVVLFMGAGCSICAGAPSGKQLTELIRKKFPRASSEANNLFDLCQDIIETPGYNLLELEQFIKGILKNLKPTKWHEILSQQNWKAIFTTNYDNLIEKAYDLKGLRECVPVASTDFANPINEPDKVFLYKVMGSIIDNQQGSQMILSREEYHDNLFSRQKTFDLLFDLVGSGTIVYVGYSGNDRIILDIVGKLLKKLGDRMPWGYMVLDKSPSEEEIQKFATKRIILINIKFEDFMEYLSGKVLNESISRVPVKYDLRIPINGVIANVDSSFAKDAESFFEILRPDIFSEDIGSDSLPNEKKNKWPFYSKGLDFERDLYKEILRKRVQTEMMKYNYIDNNILFVSGPPGSGKTSLAKRCAYDTYKEGHLVLWIDSSHNQTDFKFLADFIFSIENDPNSKNENRTKALIVLDDAPSLFVDPLKLKGYLTSVGRSALIIATGRSNEWNEFENYGNDDVFSLNLNLSEDEKPRFMKYLSDQGLVPKGSSWDSYSYLGIEDSFFAALYVFDSQSKKPFNDIIREQFEALSEDLKKIYITVAAIHQFGFSINLELLVRASIGSYNETIHLINSTGLKGLIFENQEPDGTILYSTHHPIMAEKTISFFYETPDKQEILYSKIFSDVNFSNIRELFLVERVFAKCFSAKSRATDLTLKQKLKLFEIITSQKRTRTLLHHWGLLETAAKQFEEGEAHLKEALSIKSPFEGYRDESKQNILNSLGKLHSTKGLSLFSEGKTNEAEIEFSKADMNFISSRKKGMINPYSYHSHAYMYFKKAEALKIKDPIGMLSNVAKALGILFEAEEEVDPIDTKPIQDLKLKTFTLLGEETRIKEQIDNMSKAYNNGDGYYLYARAILNENPSNDNQVLRVVEEGLSEFPQDERLLTLQAHILVNDNSKPLKELFEPLKKWYQKSNEHSAYLLYSLAVSAFLRGFYEESKKYFIELNDSSIGFSNRTKAIYTILDENNKPKLFKGEISNYYSLSRGGITSTDLIDLKTPLFFQPYRCKFPIREGKEVKFYIQFSMTGPIATDVKAA
jgi:hypothetical protein